MGKLANQLQTEALKLVLFNQLVKVDGEQFKGDADMIAENKTIVQMNNIHLVILVLFFQVF